MSNFCRITIVLLLLPGCAGSKNVRLPLAAKASPKEYAPTIQSVADTEEDSVSPAVASRSENSPASEAADSNSGAVAESTVAALENSAASDSTAGENESVSDDANSELMLVSLNSPEETPASTDTTNDEDVAFDEVLASVYSSYPLLQAALYNRNIALGQQIGASGAFDTKLKGASENGPQGFYENYRQSLGIVQPTYWGGEVFAGYRIGRGDFQPWYLERQTNGAGEFKAGVQVPLARNRTIDARRAELWKSGYERSMAEPDIQAQLIGYVQDASYGYWDWVAAGEYHQIATRVLVLAEERTNRIESQVNAGLVDPPELTDNLRLVAIRKAKAADTRRKMEQTAAKLSVYLRDGSGEPIVPTEKQLPGFPDPSPVDELQLDQDIQTALSNRPELRMLDLLRQQTQIDYNEATNQLQPELNAVVWGSQDIGEPTSSKRDKSPYESEASVYLDVPMQRRKARGKMTELQGKLAQLSAKRRITGDKIGVDVQMAHAALRSAWDQVVSSQESLKHAEDLAARERTNQEKGASDLLKVTLREQYAVESAEKYVDALKLYFESRADYRAAMALDQIGR
ncbi:MAG: TolC family protein [Planctomycetales bacterium]|nr:TolC family protein [Planctomycetales bacterium]